MVNRQDIIPRYYLTFEARSQHVAETKVSQDGSRIALFRLLRNSTAAAPANSELTISNISTGEQVSAITLNEQQMPALSPLLDRMALSSGEVLTTQDGKTLAAFTAKPQRLLKADWSADGQRLYQAEAVEGGIIHRICAIQSENIVARLKTGLGFFQYDQSLQKIAYKDQNGHVIWSANDETSTKIDIPKKVTPRYSPSLKRAAWLERFKTLRLWSVDGAKTKLDLPDLGEELAGLRLELTEDRLFVSAMTKHKQVYALVIEMRSAKLLSQYEFGENPEILGTPYIEPNQRGSWFAIQDPFNPSFVKVGQNAILRSQFPDPTMGFSIDEHWRPRWVGNDNLFWTESYPTLVAEAQNRGSDALAVFQVE
jgi:hypothetical protein